MSKPNDLVKRLVEKKMLDDDSIEVIRRRLRMELEEERKQLEEAKSELKFKKAWYKLF